MGSKHSSSSYKQVPATLCKASFALHLSRPVIYADNDSLDGDVKLWDIRAAGSVQTWSLDSSGISAFDVHPQAQVFAGFVPSAFP